MNVQIILKKKITVKNVIFAQAICFFILLVYSFFQLINWDLFPWLNLTIVFGSSFLISFFSLIVKVQLKVTNISLLSISFFQIVFSSFFLDQPDILRNQWHWLFFPLITSYCILYWDILSRKNEFVKKVGNILIISLWLTSFLNFLKVIPLVEYFLLGLIFVTTFMLLFSENRTINE